MPRTDHSLAREAVRQVYDGVEGDLFALVMGEQIHLGGFAASLALSEAAGVRGGKGVDLCCCNGAGMRFLVRYREVESMVGIDLSETVVDRGRAICLREGVEDKITFRCADACKSELPESSADFIWSEDAWCYVPNKPELIAEASRIVRTGGTIAFSDWVEGERGVSPDERSFLSDALKFPNLETLDGYRSLLEQNECEVVTAEDTGVFGPQMTLFADILEKQLRWDALALLSFDESRVEALIQGFRLLGQWGDAGKLGQVRIVARRH